MKKIKILYCVSSISSIGGISKITVDKANYLSNNGYEISIVTTEDYVKKIFYSPEDSISLYKLDINYKELWKHGFFKRGYLLIRKKMLHKSRLESIINDKKPDIIIDTCGLEISFLNKIKGKAKIIHEVHNHYYGRHIAIYKKYTGVLQKIIFGTMATISLNLTKKKLKNFDKVVVLNPKEENYWKELDNLTSIPNFLVEENLTLSTYNAKQVITAGRLDSLKGIDTLVDIWKNLYVKFPEWTLEIFGDGKEYETIMDKIKKAGLQNNVILHSPVQNIFEKFQQSSIFVTASQLESFGMTIIEAQAVGLPVVAYDCPTGPASIIDHEVNGFLVKLDDKFEFELYLQKLIVSYELRIKIGEKAYENSKKYSQDIIMKKWIDLFVTLRDEG